MLEKAGRELPLPNGDDSTPVHMDGSPLDRNFGVTLEAIKNCKKKKKKEKKEAANYSMYASAH